MKSCFTFALSFDPGLHAHCSEHWQCFLGVGKTSCLMSGSPEHLRLKQGNFSEVSVIFTLRDLLLFLPQRSQVCNFTPSGWGTFQPQNKPPEKIHYFACFLITCFTYFSEHVILTFLLNMLFFFPGKLTLLQFQTSKLFFILQSVFLDEDFANALR